MDSKELIQSIEGNFHQYYHLLNNIDSVGSQKNLSMENYKIREFLLNLNSIQDEVLDYRLRKILQEEHPYIPQIQISEIKRKRYAQFSLGQLGEAFLKQRKELIKLLYALPKEDWHRTGLHEMEGHITFKELVKRIADKDKPALEMLTRVLPG